VRVPSGELAWTPEDVERISKALVKIKLVLRFLDISWTLIVNANGLGSPCVLKSQILSGGRAKGMFDSGLVGGI
jgi:hypothetical protein